MRTAQDREPAAWEEFSECCLRDEANINETIADTRWVLTWKVTEGNTSLMDRLVAKGFQDPDVQRGLVETAGCVSLRSSHLQFLSLRTLKKWRIWSLETKDAFFEVGPFRRDVFVHPPSRMGAGMRCPHLETTSISTGIEGCISSILRFSAQISAGH